MSKPPMPDALHLGEFGALSRRVEEIERENRVLRWYLRWLVFRAQPGAADKDKLVEYDATLHAAKGLSL